MSDYYDLPEAVLDGEWPDETEHPLRRLQALCHRHWDLVPVGESFRFNTEQIRISEKLLVSFDRWRIMTLRKQYVYLTCPVCRKVTRHSAKGAVTV